MKRWVFDSKTRLLMRSDRAAFKSMLLTQRLSPSQLQHLSDQRGAEISSHAFRTTAFYRDKYRAAGFSFEDVAQPSNFAMLPMLTKEEVKSSADQLISKGSKASDRLPSRTGGSTGRPLTVYNDRNAPVAALWWRIFSWWGIHPYDNTASIYRQVRDGRAKVLYDAQWWPTRHILMDARGITSTSIDKFVSEMNRVKPALLVGYVEGVREFAEASLQQGLSFPSLRAISVTASMLHPGQRQVFEDALGAPVYDTYRSSEVPWIAAECTAQQGLHVLSDHRRVDLLDPDQETGVGDVLVTDFDNLVFPLIKYSIGDRTRMLQGRCSCGMGLPRIAPIEGRIADILRTPGGLAVSGGMSGIFNDAPAIIRQFQIHQHADYSVTIRYVPAGELEEAHRAAERAAKRVEDILHHQVPVRTVQVEQVESDGGKARTVVSEIDTTDQSPRENT